MKVAKTYPSGFTVFFLPIIIILAGIAILFPKLIHYSFYLNNIFLLFLFILLITPFKFSPATKASFNSYLITFLKISLLQLCMILLLIYLSIVNTQLTDELSLVNLSTMGASHLISWGLFPWTAIASIGIILAFFQKQSHKNISLINTLSPLFPKKIAGVFGVGIELFLRQGLITSVSIVVMILGLNLYLFSIVLGMPQIAFNPTGYTLLIFLLTLAIINNRFWENFITKLWQRQFSMLRLFWIQVIATMAVILILLPLLDILSQNLQVDLNQSFFFPVAHLSANYSWELFSWSIWIALIVFLSFLFANIIEEKNLRIVIIFSLFWPIIFVILYSRFSFFFMHVVNQLNQPKLIICITILCFIFFSLYCWSNKKFDLVLTRSYYCQTPRKHNYLPIKTVMKVLRFSSLFLLLYIFDGINTLSIIFFGLVAACFAVYFLMGLSMIKFIWLKSYRKKF